MSSSFHIYKVVRSNHPPHLHTGARPRRISLGYIHPRRTTIQHLARSLNVRFLIGIHSISSEVSTNNSYLRVTSPKYQKYIKIIGKISKGKYLMMQVILPKVMKISLITDGKKDVVVQDIKDIKWLYHC